MSLLNRSQLTDLNERASAPAVSIYLPTHRAGPEIRKDPIRLKNLLAAAESELADGGTTPEAAAELLEPARRLVGDADFWRHQRDGLAIFLASGVFRGYKLPLALDELAVVGSRFHLKPLLPLLTGDGRYYVLALSQNAVRVFEGTRHRLTELDLGDAMPRNLADAVGYDFEQRSLQFHTGTGGATRGGKRAAIFHGHGAGSDDETAEVEQFLRRLDGALTQILDDPPPPLLLAGAEPLPGTFRRISGYPRLVDETVGGNQDEVSADELHRRAWPLVEPIFRAAQEESRRRVSELLGTGKASQELEEIVRAAHDGRVGILFVPLRSQRWGTFDPETREVAVHDGAENGDLDLLDRAAVETLTQGGTVFAVPADEAPGSGDGAAILRY